MATVEDKVQSPSLAYQAMAKRWKLLHDLLGGTYAMREAGTRWLPMEPKETSENYSIRLSRAILFNGYKTAVDDLCDRPFARPLSITGELGTLEYLEDDCTRTGRSLNEFAKDVLRSASIHGLCHVLVDFPRVPMTATLADEVEQEVGPYFVLVEAPDLIGWELDSNQQIVSIRIAKTDVEKIGEFGEEEVHRILYYSASEWRIYRRQRDSNDYIMESNGTHTFGAVPLVTVYLKKTGELQAEPPLEDLAFLNLAHWQSSADQRNALRFARIGILCAAGFTQQEYDDGLVIGPNYLVKSTNPQASLKYVEHQGKAMEFGANDLDKLERQMEIMGLQPVIEKRSETTATGKTIDDSNQSSSLRSWVTAVNRGFHELMEVAGRWINQEVDVSIALFDDFGVSVRASNELTTLLDARLAGEISRETFLEELKRRGVLNESMDVEEEIGRLGEADLTQPEPMVDEPVTEDDAVAQ